MTTEAGNVTVRLRVPLTASAAVTRERDGTESSGRSELLLPLCASTFLAVLQATGAVDVPGWAVLVPLWGAVLLSVALGIAAQRIAARCAPPVINVEGDGD
jgi:hypothetical protein